MQFIAQNIQVPQFQKDMSFCRGTIRILRLKMLIRDSFVHTSGNEANEKKTCSINSVEP